MKEFRTIVSALLCMLMVLAANAPAASLYVQQLAEAEKSVRHEALLSHGVNVTPAALLEFIQNGFRKEVLAKKLPDNPVAKSQLVNFAIQELGFQESTSAVAVLIPMAKGEFPTGVRMVMQRDLELLPLQTADERRRETELILRLNSIVALGYIGDPAAVDVIRKMRGERLPPVFALEGALALGELENSSGLDDLALLVRSSRAEEKPAIYEALFRLTGRNYGVTKNTSVQKLVRTEIEFLSWYQREGSSFAPIREEVLRRRAVTIEFPEPPVTSLRGALRASREFKNFDRRYAARQQLQQAAPASAAELRQIVLDVYEDTDIRLAALDWYSAVQPKEAKKLMKEIAREDENMAVRRRAELLVPEINEFLEKQ